MEIENSEIQAISIVGSPRREPEIPERLIQVFLSENLNLIGIGGLKLIGMEHQVESGRIDILARCSAGVFYPIEVKRGIATRDAVGQLQSYIGNLLLEHPGASVRGILVAADLDGPAKAALVATPSIDFWSYRASFSFSKIEIERPRPHSGPIAEPPTTVTCSPIGLTPVKVGNSGGLGSRYCIFCKKQTETIVLAEGSAKCSHCYNYL